MTSPRERSWSCVIAWVQARKPLHAYLAGDREDDRSLAPAPDLGAGNGLCRGERPGTGSKSRA